MPPRKRKTKPVSEQDIVNKPVRKKRCKRIPGPPTRRSSRIRDKLNLKNKIGDKDVVKKSIFQDSEVLTLALDENKIESPVLELSSDSTVAQKSHVYRNVDDVLRESLIEGWTRTFDKYSPSKEVNLSPIKATEANLKSNVLFDEIVDVFTWIINMSEQHYYDNAFLLMSYSRNNVKRMALSLHRGFIGVDLEFFRNLKNITLLGNGSFGKVYSCLDPRSNLKYAIKQLSSEKIEKRRHTRYTLDYMAERNASIRAMDSAFVVRFLYSLQVDATGDLLLFFELCIGDLERFITTIGLKDHTSTSQYFLANQIDVLEHYYKNDRDILEVSFVYVFELFCGLDFLVQCNIIHRDIKPENIMLGESLHLKIGDFGLAYKTRTIHRSTNTMLVNVDSINAYESSNYDISLCGTKYFEDFEMQLMWLDEKSPHEYKTVKRNRDIFNVEGIHFSSKYMEPTFLVDTWAAGIVAVMLLFRGYGIFDPDHIDSSVLPYVDREELSLFIISLVGRQSIYENFIHRGLVKAGGKKNEELMEFIASIFKPIEKRCFGFTKEKVIRHFTKLETRRYVDMEKLEMFPTFAIRKFTRGNIYLRQIPEIIRDVYPSKLARNDIKFEEFFFKKSNEEDQSKAYKFDPAVTINFFT